MARSSAADCSKKTSPSPSVESLDDLIVLQSYETETQEFQYLTIIHETPDDRIYFGKSPKKPSEMTLPEYRSALKPVNDDEIFPKISEDMALTVAPNSILGFVKRPGLWRYEDKMGTDLVAKEALKEALVMEQVAKLHHPNIIEYYGCRVNRGRITGLAMEQLEYTLAQYTLYPGFEQLDKVKFMEALESAVASIHSLGMAHNDINPHNIMIKNNMPVLIDFGSCQPVGAELTQFGSPGWTEEYFNTSQKKHDIYPLTKPRQWLQDPERDIYPWTKPRQGLQNPD
ncbi:hypothetical protein FQN54_003425 [Arachnomyces sp. PD_36]|nr:hypothetical protein FQN54_003425 [Arachnomyces sp. PD_36]